MGREINTVKGSCQCESTVRQQGLAPHGHSCTLWFNQHRGSPRLCQCVLSIPHPTHSLFRELAISGWEMDVAGKWDNGVGMDDTVEVDTVVQEAPQRPIRSESLHWRRRWWERSLLQGAAGGHHPRSELDSSSCIICSA